MSDGPTSGSGLRGRQPAPSSHRTGPSAVAPPSSPHALEGLLVLDFCHHRPGSYTTMFLADFGAEVIRVDPPAGVFAPPSAFGDGVDPAVRAAHVVVDRNKKSL